ncbi:hypothetical protein QEJ31_09540 [Pigmentibacter sp. JX0631]|uniref:hypothetical protein n=1 Tax=Pigmentibacter sp. JX0631 TaxID=2976982 RepID=UPI0024697324|nr:hypothetical protein [Pigmentibacter sp. JX0631]WGL58767.1 hypothetical protein QEJ31_09540 [Pigmentibacter sp. JX0631]
MKSNKYFLLTIFYMIFFPTNIFASERYLSCNNDDLLLNYETFTGVSRGASITITSFTINNKDIVEYFKSNLPDLFISSSINMNPFYKENNIIQFSSEGMTINHYFKNKSEYSTSSFIQYFGQKNSGKSYVFLSSRHSKGVKFEIYENIYPLSNKPILNWYFQDCKRLNSSYSSFDPLEFWNVTNERLNTGDSFNRAANGYKKRKFIASDEVWNKHIDSWGKKDVKTILLDYTPDAQVIVNGKVFKGKNEIGKLFEKLFTIFGAADEHIINPPVILDQLVYITWHAKINGINHAVGSDSFFIQNGKIKYQTIVSDDIIFKDL